MFDYNFFIKIFSTFAKIVTYNQQKVIYKKKTMITLSLNEKKYTI